MEAQQPLFRDSGRPLTRRALNSRIIGAAAILATGGISRSLLAVEPASKTGETPADPSLEYTDEKPYRLRLKLNVAAPHEALREVVAICPYPIDWPEQKVKLLQEHKSPGVRLKETPFKGMGALLTLSTAEVRRGADATVERIYEVRRSIVTFKHDPKDLRRPESLTASIKEHLGADPGIDPKAPEIVKLQKSIKPADADAWTTARAYYDWIRRNVRFELGEYRGASKTLELQVGDCEDMTALFLALCRADNIPARTVWIEAHAYPEFYLQGTGKEGWWIPANLAGPGWFGETRESRVILQKGDAISNPITRKLVRYIPHTCRAMGGMPLLTCERTEVEAEEKDDVAPEK